MLLYRQISLLLVLLTKNISSACDSRQLDIELKVFEETDLSIPLKYGWDRTSTFTLLAFYRNQNFEVNFWPHNRQLRLLQNFNPT